MTKEFLDALRMAFIHNYEQYDKYRHEKNKELEKVQLEYLIDNAKDIVKYGSKLLENMEKSEN